jgi:hypothetical protein
MMEIMKDMLEIIQAVSITLASFVTIFGIRAWRKEATWKRKYEIAEEVLSCVYDISDRFNTIRSPVGYGGEGKSRKKNENETTEESTIMDNAYVVIERFERNKEPFTKLKSLKYRFMVVFDKCDEEPFNDISKLTAKLQVSSYRLGRYWIDQGRKNFNEKDFQNHLKNMHEQEDVFWSSSSEKDVFKKEVEKVINKFEIICKNVISKR